MIIKAVLFDMEGVVIDSEKIWDKSQEIFLAERDIIYERNKLKHLLTGRSIEDGVRIMQKMYPKIKGNVKELASERIQIVEKLFETQIEFISGFLKFRKFLGDDFKICICTAMHKELLEKVNQKLNLNQIFSNNVFSIDDVGRKSKPNPDIFLYGAKRLNVKPEECIVIEDAPCGIEAANNAGIFCIAITTTYQRNKLFNADLIVDSFEEIENFLKNKK